MGVYEDVLRIDLGLMFRTLSMNALKASSSVVFTGQPFCFSAAISSTASLIDAAWPAGADAVLQRNAGVRRTGGITDWQFRILADLFDGLLYEALYLVLQTGARICCVRRCSRRREDLEEPLMCAKSSSSIGVCVTSPIAIQDVVDVSNLNVTVCRRVIFGYDSGTLLVLLQS